MSSKWGIISRLIKDKTNIKKTEDIKGESFLNLVANAQTDRARSTCVVGAPFNVKLVSRTTYDEATQILVVNGFPEEWSEAIEDYNKHLDAGEEPAKLVSRPCVNFKYSRATNQFTDLPVGWADVLEYVKSWNVEEDAAVLKKRLLEEQLARKDEEEKRNIMSARLALSPSVAAALSPRAASDPALPSPPPSLVTTSATVQAPATTSSHAENADEDVDSDDDDDEDAPEPPARSDTSSKKIFENAGTEEGVEAWRIEGKAPVPIDWFLSGSLKMGDCYIVVKTTENLILSDEDMRVDRQFAVFYWLGSKAPVDLMVQAAFRSMELKNLLLAKSKTTLSRQEQGTEDDEFLALFRRRRIDYVEGGAGSSLVNISDLYVPRLYQIRGNYVFRIRRVELSWTSLCHSDAFILDIGRRVFIWCGKNATIQKQVRACGIATKIKYETMKCKGAVEILEHTDEEPDFWKPLGGLHIIETSGSQNDAEIRAEEDRIAMYRIADRGRITKIADRVSCSLLDSQACFVLDCETEVFLWNGRNAGALKNSVNVLLAKDFNAIFPDRPRWTRVFTMVFEGQEPICFKERFPSWEEKKPAAPVSPSPPPIARRNSSAPPVKKFDIMDMMKAHAKPRSSSIVTPAGPTKRLASNSAVSGEAPLQAPASPLASSSNLRSSGAFGLKRVDTSKVQRRLFAWKSTDNGWETLDEPSYGHFYTHSSYVYHEIFSPEIGKCTSKLYFWAGSVSAPRFWISFKFEVYPHIETTMHDLESTAPVAVQLQQFKETSDFLRLFGDQIFYHEDSSEFVRLFQLQRDEDDHFRAAQCSGMDISNLNAGSTFLCYSPAKVLIWHGSGSPRPTRKFAHRAVTSIKDFLKRDPVIAAGGWEGDSEVDEMDEDAETPEFWHFLNLSSRLPKEEYKRMYASDPGLSTRTADLPSSL